MYILLLLIIMKFSRALQIKAWPSFKEIHVTTLFRQKSSHLMWRYGKL